jgi:hypothetical protein
VIDDMDITDKNSTAIKPNDDFWYELPSTVKQAINYAKAELDRGEGIPHEQVMAAVKERLLNFPS